MSYRDDFFTALSGGRPKGQVPVWELEFHAWDSASGRHVVLGEEFARLSPAEQDKAINRNAEIVLLVAQQMNYAAVTVPNGYWYAAPGQLAYHILPNEARFQYIRALRKLAGDSLVLVASAGGIIGADYSEEFCLRIFQDPDSVDEQAEKLLRGGLEVAHKLRDCGVEVVFAAADIADNSGPFFNPQQMQRWLYPYLTRWAEAIHKVGLRCLLHSDGQLMPYLDHIAATGIDALQAIDPVAGMNMRQAKQVVGSRIGLCGNIDCGRLIMGTPDEVFRLTCDLLELARAEGGIVLGASNAVEGQVPIENYRAMIAAQRQFGSLADEGE